MREFTEGGGIIDLDSATNIINNTATERGRRVARFTGAFNQNGAISGNNAQVQDQANCAGMICT